MGGWSLVLPWRCDSGIETSLPTLISVGLEQVMSYNVIPYRLAGRGMREEIFCWSK